jgi:benzoyl-CoA-dihydrodiol lyase
LTRLVDKRRVRRDLADFFCTTEEGVRGARAVEWRLVDEVVSRSRLAEATHRKADEYVASSLRPAAGKGLALGRLAREIKGDRVIYQNLRVEIDRDRALANLTIYGPRDAPPTMESFDQPDDSFWPLAIARELDDAMLHLRFNEASIGTWVLRSVGDWRLVESFDRWLDESRSVWLAREITLYLKRTLKRLELSSRSIFALIEPGSCFVGTLFELALAADRAYMLSGTRDEEIPAATLRLTPMNFGALPMSNGLSRLENRFLGEPHRLAQLKSRIGQELDAARAMELGLVGFIPDEIDWDDEVRVALEERAAFSPDALTAMEASLRFGGPETLETKIFARLSAWQNWLFQRPNAVGEDGALKRYGSGQRATFDRRRV